MKSEEVELERWMDAIQTALNYGQDEGRLGAWTLNETGWMLSSGVVPSCRRYRRYPVASISRGTRRGETLWLWTDDRQHSQRRRMRSDRGVLTRPFRGWQPPQ